MTIEPKETPMPDAFPYPGCVLLPLPAYPLAYEEHDTEFHFWESVVAIWQCPDEELSGRGFCSMYYVTAGGMVLSWGEDHEELYAFVGGRWRRMDDLRTVIGKVFPDSPPDPGSRGVQ